MSRSPGPGLSVWSLLFVYHHIWIQLVLHRCRGSQGRDVGGKAPLGEQGGGGELGLLHDCGTLVWDLGEVIVPSLGRQHFQVCGVEYQQHVLWALEVGPFQARNGEEMEGGTMVTPSLQQARP